MRLNCLRAPVCIRRPSRMLGPIKDLKQRQRQDWRKCHSGRDCNCHISAILFSADKLVSGGVSLVDFDQLTTFLEVVKLGNFSRAGEKVFRSQSAVSAQIRQLEQEYGTKLLDRSGKRVSLTP